MKVNEINSNKLFGFSAIYLWKNLINGKVYVGQTQNFYRRMLTYRNSKSNRYVDKAMHKYGIENFDVTILEKDIPLDKLDEREQYWMDYYNSYDLNIGYNICREAGTTRGFKHPHTEEWKKEHSEKMSGTNNPMYGSCRTGKDNPNSKPTLQFDLDGNFIAEYSSAVEAQQKLHVKSVKAIQACCQGKTKTAYGFQWKYKNNNKIIKPINQKVNSQINLTNKRFDKVIVIKQTDDYVTPKNKHIARWECKCDCGRLCYKVTSQLLNSKTCSCNLCNHSIAGVTFNKSSKKWIARIYHNNKTMWLGSYTNQEDAIAARKEAELKYRK